jgi:hypothetical protein
MGYDVHITRADDWTESEAKPIRLEEWLEYVARDPEMRLDGVAEAQLPDGSTLRYENAGLAIWTSGTGEGGNWFDFRRGRVIVKNPDELILAKMVGIAAKLGARVQGDDGELYGDPSAPAGSRARTQSWWRRLLRR